MCSINDVMLIPTALTPLCKAELEKIIEEYIKTGDEKVKERMLSIMEGIRMAIKK